MTEFRLPDSVRDVLDEHGVALVWDPVNKEYLTITRNTTEENQ